MRPQPNVLDMYHGDNSDRPINFNILETAGIWGVMHKSSQGTRYKDPKFSDRIKAARDADLLVGAYHYLDSSDIGAQFDNFMHSIGEFATSDNFAIAADYEKGNDGKHASLSQLYDFMSRIDKEIGGVLTWCYSSDLIRETLQPVKGGHVDNAMAGIHDFFLQHGLWLAEYGSHENTPWPWKEENKLPFLWQFSENGRVPAVLGNVDLNYFVGTRDELKAQWRTGGKGVGGSRGGNRGVMPVEPTAATVVIPELPAQQMQATPLVDDYGQVVQRS